MNELGWRNVEGETGIPRARIGLGQARADCQYVVGLAAKRVGDGSGLGTLATTNQPYFFKSIRKPCRQGILEHRAEHAAGI